MNMQEISKLMGSLVEGLEERLRIFNLLSDRQKEEELRGWICGDQPDLLKLCEFLLRTITPLLEWNTLHDMLASPQWEAYNESIQSNMAVNDPGRYARCMKAAEQGMDGSTHQEVLTDQLEFLDSITLWDPQYDFLEDTWGNKLLASSYHSLVKQLDDMQEHHSRMGTLDDMVG